MRIDSPALAQPLCTCLQIALVDLLKAWRIVPVGVAGHSSGEIAVAYCVGVISRENAWRIAYYRGLLSERLSKSEERERTTMMAVASSESEVNDFLAILNLTSTVSIGCINSQMNVTLTGLESSIDRLQVFLEQKQIFCKKLAVTVGYHSKVMSEIADEYEQLIGDIQNQKPAVDDRINIPVYSSVIGGRIDSGDMARSQYWTKNLVSRVNFSAAIRALVNEAGFKSDRPAIVIEIGPHSALRRPLQDNFLENSGKFEYHYASILQHGVSGIRSTLEMVGLLWTCGVQPDVLAINRITESSFPAKTLTDLPSYPFNHSNRYWLESNLSRTYRFRTHPRHDLLGTRVLDWNPIEPCWRNIIRIKEMPWVAHHGFNDSAIYPAGGLIVMALEAIRQITDTDMSVLAWRLKSVQYQRPLVISDTADGAQATIRLRPPPDSLRRGYPWYDFTICGLNDTEWVEICTGRVKAEIANHEHIDHTDRPSVVAVTAHEKLEADCTLMIHHEQFYENMIEIGFNYGPSFRLLRNIRYNKKGEAVAEIHLCDRMTASGMQKSQSCLIHPTYLDSLLHLPLAAFGEGGWKSIPTMMATASQEIWIADDILTKFDDLKLKARTQITSKGFRDLECSISAVDANSGKTMIIVTQHKATATGSFESAAMKQRGLQRLTYSIRWMPDPTLLNRDELCSYLHSQFEALPKSQLTHQSIDKAESLALYFIESVKTILPKKRYTGYQSHLNKYVDWIHKISDSNLLSSWPEPRRTCFTNIQSLLKDGSSTDALQKMVVTVGQNLRGILDGSVNPLELIFEDTLAEDYYNVTSQTTMSKLACYLDLITHGRPSLKFLEIGAGTGSATNEILPRLSHYVGNAEEAARYAEYVYTDISPAFFEHARKRFNKHIDRLRFKTLDISVDPISQGFEAGAYDVIIAGSVLHATPDLNVTLSHVRKLLKPGGKLLLSEQCSMDRISDKFVFGTLPGWWYSREDFRNWSPLVPESTWNDILQNCGFSGVDFAFKDSEDRQYHNLSGLICTAMHHPITSFIPPLLPIIIIVRDEFSEQQSLFATKLENSLRSWSKSEISSMTIAQIQTPLIEGRFVISLVELEHDILDGMTEANFAALKAISLHSAHILWINKGAGIEPATPELAKVTGLARVVCSERGRELFNVLSFEGCSEMNDSVEKTCKVIRKIVSDIEPRPETEFIEKDGMIHIGRAVPEGKLNDDIATCLLPKSRQQYRIGQRQTPSINLTIGSPGLLDTLHFVENDRLAGPLGEDEVDIEVYAAALNFKDVMVALGQIADDKLGADAAGVVRAAGPKSKLKPGDRVLAYSIGALGTYLRCGPSEAYKFPSHLSFAEGASLVCVFNTVYYSLVHVARLRKGEIILIHSGAGGIGQAAIQLAQFIGAEIYVTVGQPEKRKLIEREYGIPPSHIFSSRSISFATGIMNHTDGRGVDVLLNSLAGELLEQSFECIAPFGRFIELGKRDINSNRGLTMTAFSRNVSFSSVDLMVLMRLNKPLLAEVMTEVLKLFENHPGRFFPPRPLHLFKSSNVEDAFRYMQSGNNTGKIVIEFSADDEVQVVPLNKPLYAFDPDATYVVAGGLGGLGRSIVRWMADRGAKFILVLSRSGSAGNPDIVNFIRGMADQGILIESPPCDIADITVLRSTLEKYASMLPHIRGCIQGSMVLRDSILENMSIDDFQATLRPKVAGSFNLHRLLPAQMDFMILLSSFAGTTGSPGQANYAAANTYQDALARHRVMLGEKCISLNLGLVLGVGYAAENASIAQTMKAAGNTGLREDQLLAALEIFCDAKRALPRPEMSQIILGVDTPESVRANGRHDLFPYMYRPLFSHLHQIRATKNTTSPSATVAETNFLAAIEESKSPDEVTEIIITGFVEKLSRTLAVAEREIDPSKPAWSMGVDSLLAVEIRYWFLQQFRAEVTVFQILKDQSIRALCTLVAGNLR